MSDVVKLISESFEVAKEGLKTAREGIKSSSGQETESGIIINTSANDVTDAEKEESSDSETKALPQAVNV